MTHQTIENGGARLTLFRDAPSWDGRRTAAIGRLALADPEAGASLVREAATIAASEGFVGLLGPMDGDTWHPYRVVTGTDGSPPFPMEPRSGEHDLAALLGCGFSPVSEYVSSRASVADLPPPGEVPPGFAVRPWDGKDPEGLIGRVFDMSLSAFAGAAFYKPVTRDAFMRLYEPLLPHMDPGMVLFAKAVDHRIAGFLFGYPDGAGGAVLKTYASGVPGVGRALVDAFNQVVRERGMTHVTHALMRTDNPSLDRSALNAGTVFRRYALMARSLP